MRFRIKQYNNNLQKRISEKKFLIRKRFSKIWDSFLEKGHEKMTIMLIPHNEKNIFNFHISKFTILFFMVLFLIILVSSSYAIIKNASINSEKGIYLAKYKNIRSDLLKYEKLTRDTARLVDKIKPDIEDIYGLTKSDNNVDEIWELGEKYPSSEETKENKIILPDEIFILKELQKELICTTKTIVTVKNFIKERTEVIKKIPSTIPNNGNITSVFGWRRSPFGFADRDFHSGIDIAASEGTEIKATANGTIKHAGWGQGYGNLIRIEHSYGYQTIYGHCSKIIVRQGDMVEKGKTIGYVGATGSATGSHCHYEIRLGDVPINPNQFMSRLFADFK